MSERSVPSTGSVLTTLVGVTWRRFFRGRALWVAGVIAALPVMVAVLMSGQRHVPHVIEVVQFLVLILLPPVFVAASLGEEIEERTTTYLWSRPLPRWTILIGKLIALAPIASVLVMAGWVVAIGMATEKPPATESILAFGCGAAAIASMSAGLATIVPRHAMALSIVYLVVFDLPMGAIPASLQNLSITRQVRLMGLDPSHHLGGPAVAMAIIAGAWLAVGLWRVRRLES